MSWTELHDCAAEGDSNRTEILLEGKADPNAKDICGLTALHVAAENGRLKVVRQLLKFNAEPNAISDLSGTTPLHLAAEDGHKAVVSALVDANADVNLPTVDMKETALSEAARYCRTDTVELLLKLQADPNICGLEGRTALHWACMEGHLESIKLLATHGANINIPDNYGVTCASLAKSEEMQKAIGSWKSLLIADLMSQFTRKMAERVTRESGFFNRGSEQLVAEPKFKRSFNKKEFKLFVERQKIHDRRVNELKKDDFNLTKPYFEHIDGYVRQELAYLDKPPEPKQKTTTAANKNANSTGPRANTSPPRG